MDITKEFHSSNATEIESYFDSLIEILGDAKVMAVFSSVVSFSNFGLKYRRYDDCDFYVIFDNKKCLVIEYQYIDELYLHYREMTLDEQERYEKATVKDLFNNTIEICDHKTEKVTEILRISLEYDSIRKVELQKRIKPYDVWREHDIEEVEPNPDTFDKLIFQMKNGNSFVVYPGDILDGGSTFLYSENAEEQKRKSGCN